MKNKGDNKTKEAAALSDNDLDKVAGGINKLNPHVCRCNNRVVIEIHHYEYVRYKCQSCGGNIPAAQVK